MARSRYLTALLLVGAAAPAMSQGTAHHDHAEHHSPYADQKPSGIAALSAAEIDDLRSGAGMGLARAAELNRFPGPKHVLELAAELELDADQRAAVERIRRGMLDEAERLGAKIIEREEMLDRRFAHRHIDEDVLRRLTAEIGELRGELRFVHLVAHLETTSVLTPGQIDAYEVLRGYDGGAS